MVDGPQFMDRLRTKYVAVTEAGDFQK